jgi:hypothetical protein
MLTIRYEDEQLLSIARQVAGVWPNGPVVQM